MYVYITNAMRFDRKRPVWNLTGVMRIALLAQYEESLLEEGIEHRLLSHSTLVSTKLEKKERGRGKGRRGGKREKEEEKSTSLNVPSASWPEQLAREVANFDGAGFS